MSSRRRRFAFPEGVRGLGGALLFAFLSSAAGVHASDACQASPVAAAVDVSVSDGTAFGVETWFSAADDAVFVQVGDGPAIVNAVDGPFAWVSRGSEAGEGTEFTRALALGHQLHAWWLYFDDLADGEEKATEVDVDGETRATREGGFLTVGTAQLVEGDTPDRPWGLRFLIPGNPTVESAFGDWRTTDGRTLPWRVDIDDGERVFTYRFTRIELGAEAEAWWSQRPQAAWGTEPARVYRLHRALLAAHCAGDADRLAALAAPEGRYLGEGRFDIVTADDVRARFGGVFERLDYRAYEDVSPPVIDVADSGDLAWATVEVRARGVARASGEAFDDHWAWVMLARKVDGEWRNAGIAASRR